MNYNDVLIQPVITEKAEALREQNCYVFKVQRNASKRLIKRAVQSIFNVNVQAVNIMSVRGKKRNINQRSFKKPDWKKAIVRIAPNEKIDFYAGV